MIITRELSSKPMDANIHQRILSISRLMERLLDKDIYHVGVRLCKADVYVTLKGKGGVSFLVMRKYIWEWVNHMITHNPYFCDCWMCQWRKRNRRYADPCTQFCHLLS